MTEPVEYPKNLGDAILADLIYRERLIKAAAATTPELRQQPNLPPLFEEDDWLWVAQSLGYCQFVGEDDGLAAHHRMDRIIARILEYRAEDVRNQRG